ncbi:MAG: anhydro-N-acetylmuramic acid kinase, partial [Pseudomonadota bacterium]
PPQTRPSEEDALYIGLMSGTSVDAIDCALVNCSGASAELIATHQHVIPPETQSQIADISHRGDNEIERMGALDRELGRLFAEATKALLSEAGEANNNIRAIGSHGQTVRHHPPSQGLAAESFTLQLGDPNTIAELTGITTVADFRRRDLAAGGEGAPLAPAFHAAALTCKDRNRAIINIGGIANISLLEGKTLIAGFDSGPGNTLLDHWTQRHRGEPFDRDGRWSASAEVNQPLLSDLLRHPFFLLTGPRSTGKEAFNLEWLDQVLKAHGNLPSEAVQATLAEFTAKTIANGIRESEVNIDEVYVCGGGVHNDDLMARLEKQIDPLSPASTAKLGLAPDWVEAVTFAWLAHRTLEGLHGNAPVVTGADGFRVLGAVYTA